MNNFGTLYYFELKKILQRKIVWITLFVCVIITTFTLIAQILGSSNYQMFLMDREYQKDLDGKEINQTLLEEMTKAYDMIPLTNDLYTTTEEYQKFARPYSPIFVFLRSTTKMTVSEALQWVPDQSDLYSKRKAMLESDWKNNNLSTQEKDFWLQKESELKTPFVYHRTESYFMLFRTITTIGLLVLVSVSVCLAGVFSEEHTRRTDQLILCSTYGKGIAYWAKILAGISFAIGFTLILSTFAMVLAFSVYGTEGFHAMFQMVFALRYLEKQFINVTRYLDGNYYLGKERA